MKLSNIFLLIFLMGCGQSNPAVAPTWSALDRQIEQLFPDVRQVSCSDLHDKNEGQYVLIDVRETPEFLVSHLEKAQHLTKSYDIEKIALAQPDKMILLYCSVGYRSSQMAEKLQQKGLQNVANLKGSIFEWANSGYPVYNSMGQVDKVHPYNDYWGQLLKVELRSPL
jgi:rhodanese-related sulfurtransferase